VSTLVAAAEAAAAWVSAEVTAAETAEMRVEYVLNVERMPLTLTAAVSWEL